MNNYFAIIVSFNPEIDKLRENITNLTTQGFSVVLIDNNSKNKEAIRNSIHSYKNIYLEKNYGIARALNIGMDYAVSEGADWVLSTDQDTIISDNILEVYKNYLNLPDAGALCPCITRKNGYHSNINNDYIVVERCPTSGFFISTKAWNSGCRYDEWMFIDYVDYDICIQLKIKGYVIYQIKEANIVQNLGNAAVIKPLEKIGRLIRVNRLVNFSHTYNHSPIRNYYFVRNSLYYQYKYRGFINVKKERRFLLKWEIKKLILEKNRLENIKQIMRAIKDYSKHIKKEK